MPHDERVYQFHNIAQKRRIFMLGTGPSLLKQMDTLPRLVREDTFGCNSLLSWKELPFVPTYYGVTDIREKGWLEKLSYPSISTHRFNIQFPQWETCEAFLTVEKAPDNEQVWNNGTAGLTDTLPPVPTGRTTPLTLAQLALWMGYEEIYFLGIEQTIGYVHDPQATMTTRGATFPGNSNERMRYGIQRCAARMREDIEGASRKVFDCTPGGWLNETGKKLDWNGAIWRRAFPYRDLAEVLS